MENFQNLSIEQLQEIKVNTEAELAKWQATGLKLDLSRGIPEKGQLDISSDMLSVITDASDCITASGTDCRNYGMFDGLPEAKKLFSELLNIPIEKIIVGGNSSLSLMYDAISRAMLFGVPGGKGPWAGQGNIKFLCPSPGYDRHFAICETLGIEMIPIKMTPDGPDMGQVTVLAENDPSIKGIWCVPKYSNPEGVTYSDETVKAFGALNPAAADFRIFWDNAYAVHDLTDEPDTLYDIFKACAEYGNEDRVYYFASTSKITFPGSGVAIMAASLNNIEYTKKILSKQTIGFDKINQLRHVKYFGNAEGVLKHMRRHAEILRPKFDLVTSTFKRELGGLGIAKWTEPKGGYFISLNVLQGSAKRVYELAQKAGVTLTPVGATYPYGNDPLDRNLRIAPTYPTINDLQSVTEILCLCIKQAAAESLIK